MCCMLVNYEADIFILKDYISRKDNTDKVCRFEPVDIRNSPVFLNIIYYGRSSRNNGFCFKRLRFCYCFLFYGRLSRIFF